MTMEASMPPIYVPILKGKEGEFSALEALNEDDRLRILPLIELPAIPFDYVNEQPSRTLDQHVGGLAKRIQRAWGSQSQPVLVDFGVHCEEEMLRDGRHVVDLFASEAEAEGLQLVPVLNLSSSNSYIDAVLRNAAKSDRGACIRLRLADFGEDFDLEELLGRLLQRLQMQAVAIDVVIDFEEIRDSAQAVLMFRAVMGILPGLSEWRRVIWAAASFPEDLRDAEASAISELPRLEWQVWQALQARPDRLARPDLIFGDYGITHPMLKELDPRTMRMSASIRYTGPEEWVIVKGRNVRQYGFEQYFDLAARLVAHRCYAGKDFSWGDGYIAETAARRTGPGNATTWRKVGTNHHISLVARELATMRVGS